MCTAPRCKSFGKCAGCCRVDHWLYRCVSALICFAHDNIQRTNCQLSCIHTAFVLAVYPRPVSIHVMCELHSDTIMACTPELTIASIAVGAGILALPTVTQHAGFGPSAAMLAASWAVLQLQALLIAEVNLRCHQQLVDAQPSKQDTDRVITLTEMSAVTLGGPAEAAVSSVYLLMTFTLLLAYTARAGDLLGTGLHVPAAAGVTLFTGSLAALQALGGSAGAARTTSALTAGMVAAFTAVVAQGAGKVDWAHSLQHSDWGNASQCLPLMFLSLVYHDLIPVVRTCCRCYLCGRCIADHVHLLDTLHQSSTSRCHSCIRDGIWRTACT